MDLSNMNLTEVNERLAQLEVEVREMQEVADVEKATEEKRSLLERKAELVALEERQKIAEDIRTGEVTAEVKEERKEMIPMEEKKVYGVDTKEYRDAFYAMIGGTATVEQRAILASPISVDGDAANDGAAIAIPKTLDTKIWDNIHTAHPILEDVATVASGIVMEVTRHMSMNARVAGKKDGAQGAGAEENTFVKVTLAGVDYEKYVELTYAESKMSQGALEDYLADEISAELGEALAKDVFARILSDATTAQKVAPSGNAFADVKAALALATLANKPVIYAPASEYYNLVGATDTNGQPVDIMGVLKCEVKRDDAATKITIVDPKQFVLNLVQGVMVESDKDIKTHHVIVSGYLRAEGTLRKTKAASYISA